jgi:hypothetical protein
MRGANTQYDTNNEHGRHAHLDLIQRGFFTLHPHPAAHGLQHLLRLRLRSLLSDAEENNTRNHSCGARANDLRVLVDAFPKRAIERRFYVDELPLDGLKLIQPEGNKKAESNAEEEAGNECKKDLFFAC